MQTPCESLPLHECRSIPLLYSSTGSPLRKELFHNAEMKSSDACCEPGGSNNKIPSYAHCKHEAI